MPSNTVTSFLLQHCNGWAHRWMPRARTQRGHARTQTSILHV